ncbi:hypothetical protein H1C71_022028 [Ictidomys tridecemlineatus]|nr:hypothetical protein H1C71_022028 [Ictidomys tridecemlineatus]
MDRGVYMEVHVTCACGCICMHVCAGADPGVWEYLCVCVCVCVCETCVCPLIPAPLSLAPFQSPPSPLAPQCPPHVTPQLHAPCFSVHQCVLDQEKLSCLGDPCTRSPPLPTVLCYSHGGFLSCPFHNMLFPQEPQSSERGPRWGPPGASPSSAPAPFPRRARVGVAVMACVDIL